MRSRESKLALIKKFWETLYRRDFAAVGAFFAEDGLYQDGLYQDVAAPDEGARGPREVEKRLRIGLEELDRYEHHLERMVADGSVVVTEHREDWYFSTGEVVRLPFVSIHELRAGKIVLWRDYWDMGTLTKDAPQWWLEKIATARYKEEV